LLAELGWLSWLNWAGSLVEEHDAHHLAHVFGHTAAGQEGLAVVEGKPELGGDDAAYYLQKCRGSYWFLGAGGPDYAGHHTAKFDPNEKALIHGVQFWLAMASR